MKPNWCDAKVARAWCRFVDLVEESDAPADVVELLTRVDHALLTEAIQQITDKQSHERTRKTNH
jgi:hypothetical protein